MFLCWGSFLNLLSYRLIHGGTIIWDRSKCPQCKCVIAWYDLIPVISWFILKRRCGSCAHPISWLYPFIELLTAILLSALYWIINFHYFLAYFIFFSALIVTIRSDIQTMLISRFVTLFLIPLGIIFSFIGLLPISGVESIVGALGSFIFLYATAKIFYLVTGKEGMGEGDFELLAFIGSFVGIIGSLLTLFMASFIGSLFGLLYILITKSDRSAKIPFGPFLAFAAISYVFLQDFIIRFFIIY